MLLSLILPSHLQWYAPVGYSLGNSWRIAGDCNAWPSIYNAIRVNEMLYPYASPGGWNDPDMLVGSSPNAAVHNTQTQARTQFSLWAVMAAPLLIGSNIPNISDFDLETYTNAEVIAIDQDPLGKQGKPIVSNCPPTDLEWAAAYADTHNTTALGRSLAVPSCQQVWAKPLASGAVAVNMINFASTSATISCGADCLKAAGLSGSIKVWRRGGGRGGESLSAVLPSSSSHSNAPIRCATCGSTRISAPSLPTTPPSRRTAAASRSSSPQSSLDLRRSTATQPPW